MGANLSQQEDFNKNEFVARFCGKEPISPDDAFWNKFLSYNIRPPLTRNEQIELDSKLDVACQQLLVNNPSTGNFGSLIQVTLVRVSELLSKKQDENIMITWQTYNALFAVRCILKYLIETVGEEEMVKHTEAQLSVEASQNASPIRLTSLFEILIEVLIDVPLSDFTYVVHLEAINCLLVLLSVQLFSQTPAEYSTVYRIVMHEEQAAHASVIVCTLLNNFTEQSHAPPGLLNNNLGSSIVLSIADVVLFGLHMLHNTVYIPFAGLWNVLTMGMGTGGKNPQSPNEGADKKRDTETPLASQSLLLLLVLTNHWTSSRNPYRDALFTFSSGGDDCPVAPLTETVSFYFTMEKLYDTICKVPNSGEVTLLLYMLLHRNPNVKHYFMKRLDPEALVIPILRILYHAPENTSHHIYMSLIVLLILSEDETFNKKVHEITLKQVTWYTERSISEISLGGLLILVVIRTIQYNMLKMRDKYLHTNCLAALANMSGQFRSLHPYVSQRLISLFATLAKKNAKLEAQMRSQQNANKKETNVTINHNGSASASETIQDLKILEEVLRMILEILNSCLTHQLAHNPNLVYALLYNKDIFQPFRVHPAFQDIVQNIDSVINFFSYKLEQKDQSEIGVTQVLNTIQQGTEQWPKDRLRRFPELKFKYVEEEQPEEFFIPYVWSIVCQAALIHWSAEHIKLFLPNNGEQTTIVVC